MKLNMSLLSRLALLIPLLAVLLFASFSVEGQTCDPRYYKKDCTPYYTHPNPRLPNNPMHTVSPNPLDYVSGRAMVNSGYGHPAGCAYGTCGGYIGNNNYGYRYGSGAGHAHVAGCGHDGYPAQRRSIHWGITGSIRSGNRYGSGANLGFHVGSSKSQVR